MRSSVVWTMLLAAALACAAGCKARGEDGTQEEEIESGGRTRSFLYRLPPGHTTELYWPLVVALHGRFGQGDDAEKLGHLSALADREGFVVAYPDGFRRSWNDLRGLTPASRHDVDDVGFVRDLIDWFVRTKGVDPKRVYVTGMSNGGFMTLRIACELSDRIAAAGVVTATMPDVPSERCRPARPVPIAFVNGTEDPLVDDEGADPGLRGGPPLLSSEKTRERWAALNGCAADEPLDTRRIDLVDDGTAIVRTAHGKCAAGADVVLYSVQGGGHTWPGGVQYLPASVIGKTSRDLDASEELWGFFRQRTL